MVKKIQPFLSISDKETDVYSRFTFEEVWEFINPENKYVYELRFKLPATIHEKPASHFISDCANRYKLPYHWTGTFCQTAEQYRNVCVYCIHNKITLYLSAHPKRKSIHSSQRPKFPVYHGEMQGDAYIAYILIDFDATKLAKQQETPHSSEICYRKARQFLDENPNIKSYLMMCSGNGIQLRVPVDHPIPFPKDTYDDAGQYIETDTAAAMGRVLKQAMRPVVSKYNDDYVIVDLSSFERARVGRAPFSRNYKNPTSPISAGVIELVDEGANEGLSEYILSHLQKAQEAVALLKINKDTKLAAEFEYAPETIKFSPLARLLLNPDLPEGNRNNTLFYQFKLLCKQNGIPLNHPEIQELVRAMEQAQHDKFPTNEPPSGAFNPNTVVNWCIEHMIYPIYEPMYHTDRRKRSLNERYFMPYISFAPHPFHKDEGFMQGIRKYIREHPISWQKRWDAEQEVRDLIASITKVYTPEFVKFLLDTNVLKDILEKI